MDERDHGLLPGEDLYDYRWRGAGTGRGCGQFLPCHMGHTHGKTARPAGECVCRSMKDQGLDDRGLQTADKGKVSGQILRQHRRVGGRAP